MRGIFTSLLSFAALAIVVAQDGEPDVVVAQFGLGYGPDGPWSTTQVEIGTPGQKVYLTVATLHDSVLPITPGACNGVQACIEGRGYAYDESSSSTWLQSSDRDVELDADMTAGITVNGQAYGMEIKGLAGSDTVSIGGVANLSKISVGAIKTSDLNNGVLGLRNITMEMYLQKITPSPSWSYYTGAKDGVWPPQLVFGGYDPTRYLQGSTQNHTMNLTTSGVPTMTAKLDKMFLNITGRENRGTFKTNSSLINEAVEVTIDSSTPYCWFPKEITDAIAQSVGAVWNETVGSGYYIYNTSAPAYGNLLDSTLAFHFDGTGDSWLFNSISLSHVLNLTAPTKGVSSPLPYLPFKPTENSTNVVLGRSFLQQIYLMANYYTMEFSMSQINLTSQTSAEFIKIEAPVVTPLPSPAPEASSKSRKLSDGGIAGLVIGLVAAVALILGGFFWLAWRRRKANAPAIPVPPDQDKGIYGKTGVLYRELSADNSAAPGRLESVPPREIYTPIGQPQFHPPVELPVDNDSIAGRAEVA